MTETKKKETVHWAAFEARAARLAHRVGRDLDIGKPVFKDGCMTLKVRDLPFDSLLVAHWAACAYRLRLSVHPDTEYGLELRVVEGSRDLGSQWTPTPAQAAEAGYLMGSTQQPMVIVDQSILRDAASCMARLWTDGEAEDAAHKVPLMQELGSQAHDACGYTTERLCRDLESIALGKFYSELALLTALEHPVLTEDDRLMLRRHLAGKYQAADHTALQDLRNRIKNHDQNAQK